MTGNCNYTSAKRYKTFADSGELEDSVTWEDLESLAMVVNAKAFTTNLGRSHFGWDEILISFIEYGFEDQTPTHVSSCLVWF